MIRERKRKPRHAKASSPLRTGAFLAVFLTALVTLAGFAASIVGTPKVAKADEIPDSITMRRYYDATDTSMTATFWDEGTGVPMYCANQEMHVPADGTVFRNGQELGNPIIDYIMYHGYDGPVYSYNDWPEGTWTNDTGIEAASAFSAYMGTQVAVWCVRGTSPTYTIDRLLNTGGERWEFGRALYQAALAWQEAGAQGVENGSAIFWPSVDSGYTQHMLSLVKKDQPATVELVKVSSNPDLTGGNALYSLEGAVYGVYSDEACTAEVARMTTDADGKAKAEGLTAGTYYVKEISASEGYKPDTKVHEVVLEAGKVGKVTSAEPPLNDPSFAIVQKLDGTTGRDAQGNGTLAGAQFEVKYFDNLDGKTDGDAVRTWVFETNDKGYVDYLLDKPISGDLYIDQFGNTIMPVGTYSVSEVKAPEGYQLSDGSPHIAIVDDFDGDGFAEWRNQDGWNNQNADVDFEGRAVEDQVMTGTVSVVKVDKDFHTAQVTGLAQGDASLEGAEVTIFSDNDNAVVVDGKTYQKGEVVCVLTTDAEGKTEASPLLPVGSYIARETKAPEGYLVNEDWSEGFVIAGDDEAALELSETVMRGKFTAIKTDADTMTITPQGDASLAGAKFAVVNRSDAAVVVAGTSYDPGATVMTLNVAADGTFASPEKSLPYGTYDIVETEAPVGYILDDQTVVTFEIREDGVVVDGEMFPNQVVRGGFEIEKIDDELAAAGFDIEGIYGPQGDASLAGAEIAVYNVSKNAVVVDGMLVEPVSEDATYDELLAAPYAVLLTTDASGHASTAGHALPFGKYVAIEVKAPEGYQLNTEFKKGFSVLEDGKVVTVDPLSEKVVRGDVILGKADAETGKYYPLGMGELSGTVFEIVNRSDNAVARLDGTVALPGEVVTTVTTNAAGFAQTEGGALAYGTYEYREIEAPFGYLAIPGGNAIFHISEEGVLVNGATDEPANLDDFQANAPAALNQVIRGDVRLNKINEGQKPLAGVPFVIANSKGEWHVIVTDENGIFDTSDFDEGMRDNANDAAVKVSNMYVTDGVDSDGNEIGPNFHFEFELVDESLLDSGHGVWFGGRADENAATTVDELLGSLPADTYMLYELRCSANEGLKLIADQPFTVKANDRNHGKVYDLGTRTDFEEPAIGTTLTEASSKSGDGHDIMVSDHVVLRDTVAYENLEAGKTYTVKGELHVVDVAEDGTKSAGEVIATGEAEFTANVSSGSTVVTFEFDATQLKGKDVVAFEKLYDGETEIAKHEDPTDPDQTVTIVEIKTTLTGAEGEKEVLAESPTTLVDTIAYKGLKPGNTYTFHGELYDKETGKSLGITADKDVLIEQSEGTVTVEFTFEGEIVLGKKVVAFETVSYLGRPIAVHADIEDEDQTVSFPKIGTTLKGPDGVKSIMSTQETIELIDTVAYENLTPGKTYALAGKLYQTDGERVYDPIEEAEGDEMGGYVEFTASESGSGTVDVPFKLKVADLKGYDAVAFEYLYAETTTDNGTESVLVAKHEDPSDQGQTVKVDKPAIGTTLTGKEGEKVIVPSGKITLIDTVTYSGLTPGKTYQLEGELYDKATGKSIGVKSAAEFEAKAENGSATVEFTVDADKVAGKKIVAFEKVLFEGAEIAVHADINDEGQTVSFEEPKIGTTLVNKADGSHKAPATGTVTLVDTVTYQGLSAGKTYTMRGELMDKSTNKSTGLVAETKFTAAEGGAGSVQVTFTVDASKFQGKSLVAFETAYDANGKVFAEHKDINDQGQTVTFEKPSTPINGSGGGSSIVSTNDLMVGAGIIAALGAAGAVLANVAAKIRRGSEGEEDSELNE